MIATYALIKHRYFKAENQKFPEKKSFSLFQIFIRPKLQSTTHQSILEKLGKNYLKTKNKQNIILSAYYCQDTLENYTLALNKIFSIKHEGLNLPLNYQIYKSKEFIKKQSKPFSQGDTIYNFIKSLLRIRLEDKKFCELYDKFINDMMKVELDITIVKKSINTVIRKMKNLEKKYEKILEKFPNSYEVRGMFLTLLNNIKRDYEKGQILLGKKWDMRLNPRANQFPISTESLLMFSAEVDSFGKLRFISRDLMKKLSYKKDSETELDLSSFFPTIFLNILMSELLNFVNKLNCITVIDDLIVYLQDKFGFLHECKITIWHTIQENQRNFIIGVNYINKTREYALISEEGIIDCHSKSFPVMLGLKLSHLNNTHIKENDTKINFPHLLMYKYDEIYLQALEDTVTITVQLKTFKFFNQTIIALYLSHELISCEWNSGVASDFFCIDHGTITKITDEELDNIYELPRDEDIMQKNGNLIENKSKSNDSNTLNILDKKEQKSYAISMFLMRTTKVILLILVIITQILLLISSNITIMANIKVEVNRAYDFKALVNLNYLSFALAKVSLIVRSMDLYNNIGKTQYYSDNDFLDSIEMLLKYQDPIFKDATLWKYCKSSEIVLEKKMAYWEFNGTPKIIYTDLYNFIDFIVVNAETAFYNLKKGETYKNEMMNLMYNAQGGSLMKILNSIDDLIECETDRIIALEGQRNYLIIIGAAVIAFSGLGISIYIIYSDKFINTLWEQLRTRSYSQITILNQVLTERYKKYHKKQKRKEIYLEDSSKKLNFRHSLRFLGKLSFLFIFSFIFLLLSTLFFYNHVKDDLYYQPLLISYFSRRHVQLTRMSYVILESYASERNYSLEEYYPECIPIEPAKLNFESIYSDIIKNKDFLFDQYTRKLLGETILDLIFNKVSNVSSFIQTGTYAAVNHLCQESYSNLNDQSLNKFLDLNKLLEKMNEFIFKVQGNIVKLVIDKTTLNIKTEIDEMILFVVCFSFFLLLSYFFYYLPTVQKEIKTLKSLVKILKIMTRVK